ncbi:MAG: hypothetical protein ABI867_40740 [Kofleriaceae bacterium]
MMTLNNDALANVTGGASNSAALSQSLASIQSSIGSLASNNNNSSSSNLMLPMMLMAMNRQRQASVVSANGATVVSY